MAGPALSLHAPMGLMAFSGGLMMFAKGRRREADAIGVWGAAMLLAPPGLVLTGMGQGVPWLSDVLGTAVFLGATPCPGLQPGCPPSVRPGRG